jgi:hypothetical protein
VSSIGTMAPDPDDANAESVIQAASDVIESEQENVRIEIQFAKAVRVGMLLRVWRGMMLEGDQGANFPEDWVDHATMDIFHTFFPPPTYEHQEISYYGEPDDDD